jgi:hypothetical protein
VGEEGGGHGELLRGAIDGSDRAGLPLATRPAQGSDEDNKRKVATRDDGFFECKRKNTTRVVAGMTPMSSPRHNNNSLCKHGHQMR